MGDNRIRIAATVAALRATPNLGSKVLYIVSGTGDQYLLDKTSSAADDGRLVIKPAWAGAGAGRYLILDSGAALEDEGQKAVNTLRVAAAGKGTETVTIGADVYELTTFDDARVTGGRIAVDLHGGSTVKAQGKFTQATGDVADTETVVVDGKTYTFQTVLTNVNGHVLIADTPEHTIDNFVAAVNLAAGAGTKYAAATTKHTTVSAAKSGTDKAVLTALAGGTAGNSLAISSTAAHWTRDAATLGTLTAGVDPIADEVVDALTTVINASATESVVAIDEGDNEILLVAKTVGAQVTACAETLSGAGNAWDAAAMFGGRAQLTKKMAISRRVPLAAEVTAGILRMELNFTPSIVKVAVQVTASGVKKAWDGAITISTTHVSIDNSGATDWAATDTVTVEFIE